MAQTQYELFTTPKFEVVSTRSQTYGVVTLPSSDGKREYRVDVTNGRCSCPAWKFQKGHAKPCKHLRALGYKERVSADGQKYEVAL